MQIAMYVSGMPFNGETIPNGESLGGSEMAGYEIARQLVRLGHNVILFTSSQKTGSWDGVTYEWHGQMSEEFPLGDRFHFTMQAPHDVVIIQRHPMAFLHPINSKLKIWWLHDLALMRSFSLVTDQLINVDHILTVSEFHREQVAEVYGIDKKHITATTNGVDYSFFENLKNERQPNSLIYAARPERGLENLVGVDGIMEKVPDCHLYVCGYDNTTQKMRGYYEFLWHRCEELPNVTNVGALGKKELYELMSKCMLYVYPAIFEETSCIASLEANAAGLPFIGCQVGALPETMKDGGAILLPLKDGQVDKKNFAKTIRKILYSGWKELHNTALTKHQDWQQAAIQWDKLFSGMLETQSESGYRLHRHLEHYSDIIAAVKDDADKTLSDLKKNYDFLFTGNYKEHYQKYYEYEKNRGVVYGPEDLTGNRRFEATVEIIEDLKPKSVLDYGCAHGHYSINLLHKIPGIQQLVGIDINNNNIQTAKKWAIDTKLENRSKFIIGTEKQIEGKYDLIIATEVLEHVPDPEGLVKKLKSHLNTDGTILISTPYGPWEALGYENNQGWRAHIHHFERSDLLELFGKQKEYKLLALPHRENLGHFIVTFKNSDEPIGKINYERKLRSQAPAETLSVCMIAKDEAYTIGKTLSSVKSIADEIIVGIDKTTTDETKKIVEAFGAKTFEIESPLKIGFDAARNQTIEKATMDWVMWIDADETFENTQNLKKYLRQNCFDGYAIKQHHYSVEPAALFKTDFPVRIFRNRQGIQFFGFVHEHPEKEFNKGVGKVIALQDVAIMHTGYSTETIRRKRFDRNFPLMQIDREKYPERKLGKFLWMRDLAHFIRYNLERNGGRLTPEIQEIALQVVSLWRELLKQKETRMLIEGVKFYSEAVAVLGDGIDFVVDLGASKGNGNIQLPIKPVKGLFANIEDIDNFTHHLVDVNTQHYTEKYF